MFYKNIDIVINMPYAHTPKTVGGTVVIMACIMRWIFLVKIYLSNMQKLKLITSINLNGI